MRIASLSMGAGGQQRQELVNTEQVRALKADRDLIRALTEACSGKSVDGATVCRIKGKVWLGYFAGVMGSGREWKEEVKRTWTTYEEALRP